MTTETPSFLTDEDLAAELRAARLLVDRYLAEIRDFAAIAHDRPWLHLDDVLRELRAAVATVHVLEQLQGSR